MTGLNLRTVGVYRGLQVITLENELLRVQILPQAGAKIWQITYLPLDTELLRNNPHIPPQRHAILPPMTTSGAAAGMNSFPTMKRV